MATTASASMKPIESPAEVDLDVAIIGAGLSGINTAHYIQTRAPPGLSYSIFEARSDLGGTWDLWRYPGIRSDSDIYTFGFSWNPWEKENPLAPGAEILAYLHSSAAKYGIDKKIQFNHRILAIDWSRKRSAWSITLQVGTTEVKTIVARFVVLGTGYYDYEEPMYAPVPGLENFTGTLIRPQWWPEDLDYTNKSMVVIGSGATAVTIVPSVADKVKHVTMLQRSPTYIVPLPKPSPLIGIIKKTLPHNLTRRVIRLLAICRHYKFYYWCTYFPEMMKRTFRDVSIRSLPPEVPFDPHFKPRYNPWEQRFCVCPNGDFYAAIRSHKASVVTDTIEKVTADEIQLASGQSLRPDIIVAATGLKLRFAGGIKISVDGKVLDPSQLFVWKGCMLQDVPNLMFIFGYVNASWTLGAEASGTLLGRLLSLMRRLGVTEVVPRPEHPELMKERPFLNLTSTYFKNASKIFPKSGEGLWQARAMYPVAIWDAMWGNVAEGLEMR